VNERIMDNVEFCCASVFKRQPKCNILLHFMCAGNETIHSGIAQVSYEREIFNFNFYYYYIFFEIKGLHETLSGCQDLHFKTEVHQDSVLGLLCFL